MALDSRRLEALSLQELSALLDDEEQLQDMAREMEEVRGCLVTPRPRPLFGPPPSAHGVPGPLGVGGVNDSPLPGAAGRSRPCRGAAGA